MNGQELPVLVASLLSPGADPGASAHAMLAGFVADGWVVLVVDGPRLRIEYDRERWSGVSPERIEEAFRREREKDADELRRLGAV